MEIFTDMGVTDLDSAENFDLNQVKIVVSPFFKNLLVYKQSVVLDEIGDEFHYLLVCPLFKDSRVKYIKRFYYGHPNTNKMTKLFIAEDEYLAWHYNTGQLAHFSSSCMVIG